MFRSLYKAASKAATSLEQSLDTVLSTAPESHSSFINVELTLGSKRVRLGRVVAEGGYSFIHVARTIDSTSSSTPYRYAVKRVSVRDGDARLLVEREMKVLEKINGLGEHPHIITYYGGKIQDGNAFFLFDFLDGGTLSERLLRSGLPAKMQARQRRTDEELLQIFSQVASGIAHLHACEPEPIAVMDIKMENVLYDRLGDRYRLIDFGSAMTQTFDTKKMNRKQINTLEEHVASHCTTMYCAPELIDLHSGGLVCEKVDIWALGCIWYAMLFGNLPFDGSSALAITTGITYLPDNQSSYPKGFIDILRACMSPDPAERADIFAILQAIRELQKQRLEPQLATAAKRLRARRNRDFGHIPQQMAIRSTGIQENLNRKGQATTREFQSEQHDQRSCTAYKNGDDDEDWGEFTQAQSSKTPTTYVDSESQQQQNVEVSLIDFSDVDDQWHSAGVVKRLDPLEALPTLESRTSSSPVAAHVDDETDLVNMFSRSTTLH